MRIVILGLSITSSWGNGHATTYRALVRALVARGHDVLFLERDVPWYAAHRDLPMPPWGRTTLYSTLAELRSRFAGELAAADLAIVGSYVPEGVQVGEWVLAQAEGLTAFYDLDTPVTLAGLERGTLDYLSPAQIRRYDLYLSFMGGPILERLERHHGASRAVPFYCAVDPAAHYPEAAPAAWDLAYMGTYSADRQPALDRLLLEPARRLPRALFAVAGPQYPSGIDWPANVRRVEHLPPDQHRPFYSSQRFTLNLTRADMVRAGWSPSVRLFEAAACGTAIISDWWPGLDEFFAPGRDILIARSAGDTCRYLRDLPDGERRAIGARGRQRVLDAHTAAHRAVALESLVRGAVRPVPASICDDR
jgi:spore maturation protein CgeB